MAQTMRCARLDCVRTQSQAYRSLCRNQLMRMMTMEQYASNADAGAKGL